MEAITTHNSTDFDALASLVAASLLHPEAVMVLPSRINPNVQGFLSIHKDLFDIKAFKDVDVENITRLVVTDTNQWKRIDRLSMLSKKEGLDIHVWDHHDVETDMNPSFHVQDSVGACTTLFVEDIKKRNISMTPMQATLFLAGIYEDTGNLAFPSTTSRDAKAVAHLLDNQADLGVLENFLRPAYGVKQKDVLFEMLQKAERLQVEDFYISICEMDIRGHTHGLSLVVHMYRDILNVDAAFGVFNDSDKKRCIVIARSRDDSLDVGNMMRVMGGGGHPAAGSAMLRNVKPEGVREWIYELIQENQRSSIHIGDLMSFPVDTIDAKTNIKEAAVILKKKGISGMPVTDQDRLVGVISRRDINKLNKESQWKAPVKAFMSTDVITAPADMSVPKASRLLVKHDVGRLPVIEDGKIIGIFTRSDAMLYYYDMLPE